MEKFSIFTKYILLSVIVSGLFGIMNDQISYTVSSEYYTKFKFHQFVLLNTAVPERVRVAQVGFLASWWMGALLGVLTGVAGFLHHTAKQMRRVLLLSLPVAVGCASAFALGGLAYGFFRTTSIEIGGYRGWYIPDGLEDLRAFLCVGYMHKAAYCGGLLSIPVVWLFHFVSKRRVL